MSFIQHGKNDGSVLCPKHIFVGGWPPLFVGYTEFYASSMNILCNCQQFTLEACTLIKKYGAVLATYYFLGTKAPSNL